MSSLMNSCFCISRGNIFVNFRLSLSPFVTKLSLSLPKPAQFRLLVPKVRTYQNQGINLDNQSNYNISKQRTQSPSGRRLVFYNALYLYRLILLKFPVSNSVSKMPLKMTQPDLTGLDKDCL